MKAIVQDSYGSPGVLQLRDVDTPTVGAGEVLVRVHAAGLDPGEWALMSGDPYMIRVMGFGLRRPKLRVRGTDVAGRVEAVGEGVTDLQPGAEVFGLCRGSFTEYACDRADKFMAKPANLDLVQAAALPSSGLTALQVLRDYAKLTPGQKCLIIGASGGVGTFAVQIGKAFGAEVTGVCSTTGVELILGIGADHAIDYTEEDFADGRQLYDVILDTGGNRSLSHLRRALASEGTLVIIGGRGGRLVGGTDRNLRAILLSPFVGQTLRAPFLDFLGGQRENLRSLKELVEAGKVTPVIDRTYPLAEVPNAMRYLREGHPRGKVVITV